MVSPSVGVWGGGEGGCGWVYVGVGGKCVGVCLVIFVGVDGKLH